MLKSSVARARIQSRAAIVAAIAVGVIGLCGARPAMADPILEVDIVNVGITNGGFVNGYIDYDPISSAIGAFAVTESGFSAPLSIQSTDPNLSLSAGYGSGYGGEYFNLQNDTASLVLVLVGPVSASLASSETFAVNAGYSDAIQRYDALYALSAGQTVTIAPLAAAVPEPASLAILGSCVFGIGVLRRRRARTA